MAQFVTGQIVTAADLNGVLGASKIKTADESVASSITLQDDNDLLFPVLANEIWAFQAFLWVAQATNVGGGIRYTFSGPSGSTGNWGGLEAVATVALVEYVSLGTERIKTDFGVTSARPFILFGRISNGATAGDLKFRWAQETSDADATILKASSVLVGRKRE